MKRTRLWAVSVITVAVVVGLLGGCGGGGGGSSQDFIVGTWELYAISFSLDGYKDPNIAPGVASIVHCWGDRSYEWTTVYPGGRVTTTGTWTNYGSFYLLDEDGIPEDIAFFPSGPDLYMVITYEDGTTKWLWFAKE